MRILHTADWHLGKLLKGIDRTPEVAKALEELLEIVRKERVDLVVVAGDLFDRPQVSVEAEEAAWRFFLGLHELGVPALVIAGNHDSRDRLEVHGRVLARFGVVVRGEVRFRGEGGVVDRPVRAGLLPFLSERRLLNFQEGELGEWRGQYAERMEKLLRHLSQEEDLLLAHLTVEGVRPGGGEFAFYLTNSYALPRQALPQRPRYIALGHIHRQEQVAENAWYSGSLIQLDFGEHEDAPRGALLVELPERGPARVFPVRGAWGRPLRTFRVRPEELDRAYEEMRRFGGYMRLVVEGHLVPEVRERLYQSLDRLLEIQQIVNVPPPPPRIVRNEVEAYCYYLESRYKTGKETEEKDSEKARCNEEENPRKKALLDRFRQVLMEVEGASL